MRFLHNPKESQGYVGTAVGSSVFRYKFLRNCHQWHIFVFFHYFCRFYKNNEGQWSAERVIKVPPKNVSGWFGPYIGGIPLTTFITRVA